MRTQENLGSFYDENKALLQDYLETRLEIIRLQGIKVGAKAIGYLAWLLISMFFLLLIFIFTGLVIGFWFSAITGSYVAGFGIATLILVIIVVLLAVFRKALFVHPIIRNFIRMTSEPEWDEDSETGEPDND